MVERMVPIRISFTGLFSSLAFIALLVSMLSFGQHRTHFRCFRSELENHFQPCLTVRLKRLFLSNSFQSERRCQRRR